MNNLETGSTSNANISPEMLQNLIDLEDSLSPAPLDLGPSIIKLPNEGTRVVTIAVLTAVFITIFHLVGYLTVPGYLNFKTMHALSLAVAATGMVFLSLISVHAKLIREA